MDNKEIIPFDNEDISQNSVLVVKRRKRKKKHSFFKRLLCFLLIVGICYFVYSNYDKLVGIKDKIIDNFSNTHNSDYSADSDTSNDDTLTSDSDTESLPNDIVQVPEGAFDILSNSAIFTEINNKSQIELNFDYSDSSYCLTSDIYNQYGNEAPVVLIIHSSSMESYSNGDYYSIDDNFYSNENNVASVGKLICDTLNDKNVNAIHIDDIFANGGIYKSREEFEKALASALKRYPSISYVLDISRDILINDDFTMNKMITNINGNDTAQIKITIGTSTDENKTFWHKNLSFANKLATENPNLIYDVTLAGFELSQNIMPISMRVDVGAYSSSINEALLAGKELAICLSNLLSQGR